jgi:hypothetical protein
MRTRLESLIGAAIEVSDVNVLDRKTNLVSNVRSRMNYTYVIRCYFLVYVRFRAFFPSQARDSTKTAAPNAKRNVRIEECA